MVNLSAPKTFSIAEYMLERKQFTQYRICKELGINISLVNRVSRWLLDRGLIVQRDKKYELRDAAGLIAAMQLFRHMKNLQLFEAGTAHGKQELMKLLPKSAVFCLDSALANYTNWWRSDKVCAYIDKKYLPELRKQLLYRRGNKTVLRLFLEKPTVEKKAESKGRLFTPKIRTVIDMVCDGQINAVEPLFKQIWGQKIGKL